MAYKVKAECINPANGRRMQPGEYLDPVPAEEEIARLKNANAIVEVSATEFDAYKADERRKAAEQLRASEAMAKQRADEAAAERDRRAARPAAMPVEGQSTPAKEADQKAEIDKRAGQRLGDDNSQRKK